MSTVNSRSTQQQQINTSFAQAASDGQITHKEARELNQFIDKTSLSAEDKTALKKMVSELNKATTGNFLFFSWKSKITPSEMQGLQTLAQTNSKAQELLQGFQSAQPTPAPAAQDQARVGSRPRQASFQPGGGLFGSRRANASSGVQPLSSGGRAPSWMVSQSGTGLRSASGDCGPASAAMVARRFGFNTQMNSRDAVQAARNASGVTSRRGGAWAISEDEVTKAIRTMTGGSVRETADTGLLSAGASNRNRLISTLQQSLSNGDMPILLTGSPSTRSRHYMVVTDVKPQPAPNQDKWMLTMADPAGGRVWNMSQDQLDQLMQKADRRGGSRVMAYGQ